MKNIKKKLLAIIMVLVVALGIAPMAIMQNEYSMTGGDTGVALENKKKLVASNNKYKLKTPTIKTVTRKPLTQAMKTTLLKKEYVIGKGPDGKEIKSQPYCDNYTDTGVDMPENPVDTTNVDDADYIKLTWGKVAGATGYQVKLKYYVDGEELTAYNQDHSGQLTYYPYVKSTTKTSVTINELQSHELIGQNATVKIWVRAYKTSGGKKYYGSWSSVTTVKPNKHLPSAELLSMTTSGNKTTITVMPNDIYICQAAGQDQAEVLFRMAPIERNKWCYVQDGYQVQYSNSATFEKYESIKIANNNDYKEFMEHMEGKWSYVSFEYVVALRLGDSAMEPVSIEFPSGYKYMRVRTYKVINGKTQYGVWTSGKIKEILESDR